MHYIIQENIFKEYHYDILEKTLIRGEFPYITVRIFPFVNKIVDVKTIPENYEIEDLEELNIDSDKIFVFGAIKLARVSKDKSWYPGSMMNVNHDFSVYKNFYKNHLLNYDSEIQLLNDQIHWNKDEQKFIRPTKDTKSFSGQVFTEQEWNDTLAHYTHNFTSEIFNEFTEIQVSTVKNILKEIRFWVVGGKIVTWSQYKLGDQVAYSEHVDEDAIKFAQKMVNLYEIAEAFVIDICLVDDVFDDSVYKIVECNCINCAGFYKADMTKLITALEDHFDSNFDEQYIQNTSVYDRSAFNQ